MSTFPIERIIRITPQVHGSIGVLGNAFDGGAPGFISVQIATSADFAGSFQVVGSAGTKDASDTDLPFVQVPYTRIYVDNAVADYGLVTDDIVGNALIQIPANGIKVGLVIACTAGSAWVAPLAVAGNGTISTGGLAGTPSYLGTLVASGGLGAANTTVTLALNGVANGGCSVQIIGTYTGTVTYQVSADNGSTYSSLYMTDYATGSQATTLAATGAVTSLTWANLVAVTTVRANMTSYTSGTALVRISAQLG